jgi:hypothetical protein
MIVRHVIVSPWGGHVWSAPSARLSNGYAHLNEP